MDCKDAATFYFLNSDLSETLTGIESNSLLRARMFQNYLNISPIIATSSYNPRLHTRQEALVQAGLLDRNTKLINLYDQIQETANWNNGGQIKGCRNDHADTSINENFIRKDTYDDRGFLSRTQFINPEEEKIHSEQFYRLDGSICIKRYFNFTGSNNRLTNIQLLDHKGERSKSFGSEAELIEFWIRGMINDNLHSIVFVDNHRVFYPVIRQINQFNLSIVCTIHSSHLQRNQDYLHGKINSQYENIFDDLSKPDALIFLTNLQRQHVNLRFEDFNNTFTIPRPIEEVDVADFNKRLPFKVVCAGNHADEVQLKSILRAFRQIAANIPDASLDIYGFDEKEGYIIEQINNLGLMGHVFRHKFTTDFTEMFDRASISIIPRRVEGFPSLLVESIAHGCPTISFDINYGQTDIIEHGINGFLVQPRSEIQIAEYILDLFENPDKREKMSREAYSRANSFKPDQLAEKWSYVLELIYKKRWINQATMDRADYYLSIPTYDGSGQCVHPSVKYFPDKWNGYYYWMAMTPYADTNDDLENASIVVSNDGETWFVPEGLTNPIAKSAPGGYNSDPNLYYENGTLYLLNRRVNLADKTEEIYVYSSTDGIHWSDPIKMLESDIKDERILSPCLLKIGDQYVLYSIDIVPSLNEMKFRTCSTITGEWSAPERIPDLIIPGSNVWHFEIINYEGYYVMLLQDCIYGKGARYRGRLYLGISKDGKDWDLSNTFFRRLLDFTWEQNVYKASLQPSSTGAREFDIWYSANTDEGQWHIGKSKIKFNKDLLISNIKRTLYNGTLYSETFQREDGKLGDQWITTGSITIKDNKVGAILSNNNKAIIDINKSDYEVTICFNTYVFGEQFLLVRASNISSFIRCGRSSDNFFVVENVDDGFITSRFIKSDYIPSNGDYLTVRCSGSILSIYINGVLLVKGFSHHNRAATHIGIQCPDPGNYFSDLSVKAII